MTLIVGRRLTRVVRLGRYSMDPEAARTLWRMHATRRRGPHPHREGAPREVALATLRANAGDVISSGGSHFRAMWVADTGKAFAGLQQALPDEVLTRHVERVVAETSRRGDVPVCVTPRGAHDIPWPRADGLPWLLHMARRLGDSFVARHGEALRTAYDAWRERVLVDGEGPVRVDVTGDWIDTIPRPSSTYNNLCALRAHDIAAAWSWPGAARRRDDQLEWLLRERWREGWLAEDASSEAVAADAQAHAIYLDAIPGEAAEEMAGALARSGLLHPVPMRARVPSRDPRELPLLSRLVHGYHEAVWTHLGWMLAAGLRARGMPWRGVSRPLVESVRREGSYLETLEPSGAPHVSRWLATEHDFTMSAGLALEVLD